ncbi:hypothetical protein [Glaciimonas sp. PCH181]|uniref:hypothetical protein n=1 Tax=Glaciimonas sp. PCH181 TaxID=2133943 RepID=UPI000D3BAFBF|nr:hypothetical protein [Glaciimonas sp. PCH181]PUA19342.1 hypothetical protein C7W93_05575 [Glaciimonas sp. PCH181]
MGKRKDFLFGALSGGLTALGVSTCGGLNQSMATDSSVKKLSLEASTLAIHPFYPNRRNSRP